MPIDITEEYYARNWDGIEYDHRRVRPAMDRVFAKYPESERYEAMVSSVQEMLGLARRNGSHYAIEFQQKCLRALSLDKR